MGVVRVCKDTRAPGTRLCRFPTPAGQTPPHHGSRLDEVHWTIRS